MIWKARRFDVDKNSDGEADGRLLLVTRGLISVSPQIMRSFQPRNLVTRCAGTFRLARTLLMWWCHAWDAAHSLDTLTKTIIATHAGKLNNRPYYKDTNYTIRIT